MIYNTKPCLFADSSKAKIVFPQSSVGFIIGKEGTWIKELCDRCGVSIKFQQDSSIRCVKKDEAISVRSIYLCL